MSKFFAPANPNLKGAIAQLLGMNPVPLSQTEGAMPMGGGAMWDGAGIGGSGFHGFDLSGLGGGGGGGGRRTTTHKTGAMRGGAAPAVRHLGPSVFPGPGGGGPTNPIQHQNIFGGGGGGFGNKPWQAAPNSGATPSLTGPTRPIGRPRNPASGVGFYQDPRPTSGGNTARPVNPYPIRRNSPPGSPLGYGR
jgi:hypothetical protein